MKALPAGLRTAFVLTILVGAWAKPRARICIRLHHVRRSTVARTSRQRVGNVRGALDCALRRPALRGSPAAGRSAPSRARGCEAETSRARSNGVKIPFRKVVKRTSDGRLWALQYWRRKPDAARELRFSRWTGSPPRLAARTTCCREGRQVLRGRVTYHRGAVARADVYVDCFACPRKPQGWTRLARRKTSQSGRFSLVIPRRWEGARYRATLLGPNFGWVRAPDMRVFTRLSTSARSSAASLNCEGRRRIS